MPNNNYIKDFTKAVQLTLDEGYLLPSNLNHNQDEIDYPREEKFAAFYKVFKANFADKDGNFDFASMKGQCINYHYYFAEILKRDYNIDSFLTIGYVNYNNKDYYKFESIDRSLLRRSTTENREVIDIHVWLTLPTYEIVDLTFLVHYYYVNLEKEEQKKYRSTPDYYYIFGFPEFLNKEHEIIYHPKYIGEDILRKIGFLNFNFHDFTNYLRNNTL